uniref:Glycosyltransferase sugar-binding region containing DXD motif protein n=1 Tax=Megaviridae environmental sample TaxID=1737588 RepID=A0A5J6VMV2_9VIRU|nr:MAG: hypothetical protein [Megaviridae environmental sample]
MIYKKTKFIIICSIFLITLIFLYYTFPSKKIFTYDPVSIKYKININSDSNYKNKPVPKVLYRTWCTSTPTGICGGRKANILSLQSTRTQLFDWKEVIYGDKEVNKFFDKEFGKNNIVTRAFHLINPKYGAAKADFFRYCLIYKYGGLYLDMKSCAVGNLPPIPKNKDIWISTWPKQTHLFKHGEFINWFIYARKHAPILKDVIEKIVNNIFYLHYNPDKVFNFSDSKNTKGIVLSVTGPIAYTIAIKESKHFNTVYFNNKINKILKYTCNINNSYKNMIDIKQHYSSQTEPIIMPNI